MCSIFCLLDLKSDPVALRRRALEMSRLMRHRGPDWSGIHTAPNAILAHERLAIVDPVGGAQPLKNAEGTHVLAVNGEIYNHQELKAQLKGDYEFQTGSDCEVILALYKPSTARGSLTSCAACSRSCCTTRRGGVG
jgi:asparagine synthase (glutamine-hydrolysing)